MSRAIVPIANLQRRLPTAGRLRLGKKVEGTSKGGKKYTRPEKIDTWRATSHDREAIEQIAAAYGGTVRPWDEPKAAPGQWEVITTTSELPVVLPPDPLGGTPVYELWSGGGCERRCDGETCTVIVTQGEDVDQVEVPCKCAAAGELACKVKVRLSVILPAVKFAGVWRVESSGWNAATELPGMVDLIQSLQARGLTRGLLALEPRRQVTGGKTRQFMVPTLRIAESMDAIASGAAQVGALASVPAAPALAAGNGTADPDDEVVDGEVVEPDASERWKTARALLPADALAALDAEYADSVGDAPFEMLREDHAAAWASRAEQLVRGGCRRVTLVVVPDEMRRLSLLIDEAVDELRVLGERYAQAEFDYRKAKAEAWQVAPSGTVPEREAWVNGQTASDRLLRDRMELARQTVLESVRSRRAQVSALQTLLNANREEAAFARTGPEAMAG